MEILVIGATGQVARSLAERALHHPSGARVHLAGRSTLSLCDEASLHRAIEATAPDAIINAAAYTAVDAAEEHEADAHRLNAEGPAHLAKLAGSARIPLIHISTDYVFDGQSDRPYREADDIAPQSAYGRTKAAGEAAIRSAGGRAMIVRTAWVYSPFGKNFVKTMLHLAATRPELRVVNDQHGNPTSALDLADTLLSLAARPLDWPAAPDTVHCVSQGEATWYELARAAVAAAGFTPKIVPVATSAFPTAARRPSNSRLDTAYLRERYKLALPDWRDSLPEVVARLRAA